MCVEIKEAFVGVWDTLEEAQKAAHERENSDRLNQIDLEWKETEEGGHRVWIGTAESSEIVWQIAALQYKPENDQ